MHTIHPQDQVITGQDLDCFYLITEEIDYGLIKHGYNLDGILQIILDEAWAVLMRDTYFLSESLRD